MWYGGAMVSVVYAVVALVYVWWVWWYIWHSDVMVMYVVCYGECSGVLW